MPSESHENLKQSFKNYDETIAKPRTSITKKTGTTFAETGTYDGHVLLDKMYGMSIQDGTPTPSVPVAINSAKANFRNSGKNLWDLTLLQSSATSGGLTETINNDGTVTISNGTTTGELLFPPLGGDNTQEVINKSLNLLPNHRYKISMGVTFSNNQRLDIYIKDTSSSGWSLVTQVKSGNSYILETPSSYYIYWIRFAIPVDQTVPNLTLKPMITLADVTDQTFEPYQAQSITTDLTLRAIEVTSSDDYNLVKDGKYYIADTLEKIDGGYQITRRIRSRKFNSFDDWGNQTSWEFNNKYQAYYTETENYAFPPLINGILRKGFSRIGVFRARNDIANDASASSCCLFVTITGRVCILFPAGTYSSIVEFLSAVGNEEIIYISTIPTTESVSASDAQKLLSLKSYDEATYIAQTEDVEGQMTIAYGSSELINDTITALVNSGQNDAEISELNAALTSSLDYLAETGVRNIFDQSQLTNSSSWQYVSLSLKANTKYTVSSPDVESAYTDSTYPNFYAIDSSHGAGSNNAVYKNNPITVTTGNDGILKLQYRTNNNSHNITDFNFMVEIGSTAHSYQPYAQSNAALTGLTSKLGIKNGDTIIPPVVGSLGIPSSGNFTLFSLPFGIYYISSSYSQRITDLPDNLQGTGSAIFICSYNGIADERAGLLISSGANAIYFGKCYGSNHYSWSKVTMSAL